MAAAEVGEVDSMRVLIKELGCNKDVQDKVTVWIHALFPVTSQKVTYVRYVCSAYIMSMLHT